MGPAVRAGGAASPVLEPVEPAFNAIALLEECGLRGERLFAGGPPRGPGRERPLGQGCPAPIAGLPLSGAQPLRVRPDRPDRGRPPVGAALPCWQEQNQGVASAVPAGRAFRVAAAPGAPKAARKCPLVSRLAAVRWACKGGASISTGAGAPPARAKAAKTRLKRPAWRQRPKRWESVLGGPEQAGAARPLKPFRVPGMSPERTRRSSTRGPPRPLGGNSGWSRAHWAADSQQ